MKFGLVIFAISLEILGVQSAGSPATANSVYIDVQIKICLSMVEFYKNYLATRDYLNAAINNDNKTVTNLAKSSYDSITSEIKKVLGPLAAVTNPDIQAELLLVLNAVSTVQNLTSALVTEFYSNEKSAFSNLDNVLFENYLVFGYKFKEMLDSVALAVTDKTLNAAKIADCEKTNFALIDDILKQLKTNAGPCFKGYVTDDKYLIGNVTLLFKSISQAAFTPLNNVTLCLKSNALTDAKSINAASNCTVAAFVTCLGYGIMEALAFAAAFTANIIGVLAILCRAKHDNFNQCQGDIYLNTVSRIEALGAPLITCVTKPAP